MQSENVQPCRTEPQARESRVARGSLWRRGGEFGALDGIRALAAILIVVFHCVAWVELVNPRLNRIWPLGWVQEFAAGCWIGVDVFFLLSGFLIGRILLEQFKMGRVSLRAFYVRRVFRIFPAYYLVLTLSIVGLVHCHSLAPIYGSASWRVILARSPANYLYLGNYLFGGRVQNAMSWSWSLCIEEHFYLLLPPLLVVLFRYRRASQRWLFLAAFSFLPLLARAAAYVRNPTITVLNELYYRSHTHADGLFLGVLIAYFHVFHRDAFRRLAARVGAALPVMGGALIASVYWKGGPLRLGAFAVVLQFAVLAVGTGLFVINGLYLTNLTTRFLAWWGWRPIARLSYGIYLVHVFVVFAVRAWWPGGQDRLLTSLPDLVLFVLVVTGLSTGAAGMMFFAIEGRLLRVGARLSHRYIVES